MQKKAGAVQSKLKLIKEYSLSVLTPWRHGRAKIGRNKKKYNPYGEDFVKDRFVLSNMLNSLVGLVKVVVPQEIDLVNYTEHDWIDDPSEPEMEFEPATEQMHEHLLTNLCVLDWLHDQPAFPYETILSIQDVDQNSIEYISHDNLVLSEAK